MSFLKYLNSNAGSLVFCTREVPIRFPVDLQNSLSICCGASAVLGHFVLVLVCVVMLTYGGRGGYGVGIEK